MRTLQQLADDEKKLNPKAARVTQEDVYVDDYMTGAATVHEAKELQSQLINMLNSASFELQKWVNNQTEVLDYIPIEHLKAQ